MKKLKVVITGATGMVGEGVLHMALNHPRVESVLVLGRRSCGVTHAKLKEVLHADFLNLEPVAKQLSGYNAAFLCAGVSSMGMKMDDYRRVTYDLTMHVAKTLQRQNPNIMVTYVSGEGTDSSGKSRMQWARIKGQLENDLLAQFKKAYMFRPGMIQPINGLHNTYKIYKILGFILPVIKRLFPANICTLEDLGLSMLHVALNDISETVLDNRAIGRTAEQERRALQNMGA